MKTLELSKMEFVIGGLQDDCVAEAIGAGVSGALLGIAAGPPGVLAGWLTGSLGGLVACAINNYGG